MIKLIFLIVLSCFLTVSLVWAEEKPQLAPALTVDKPEEVDISDLENQYWRPSDDELEVVQNKKYQKAGRFEFSVFYGIYQGGGYLNSRSHGLSAVYNFSERWATELFAMKINNQDSDFLHAVKAQYGFTPDFNAEKSQYGILVVWTPIYAKFALLGSQISHFDTYIAPGVGLTQTAQYNFTKQLAIGEKFFITEHLILRLEWLMSFYTDRVNTPQGSTSTANGGPGYVNQSITRHNLLFGLGWLF
jgi:outer membrane beta-barrel protein